MGEGSVKSGWSGAAGAVSVLLARVVVPLWLLLGAVLKIIDLSPTHLPTAVVKWCGSLGVDLLFVLRFSIAAELVVAGAMILLAPLARWVGIAMLTAFLPVLVGDLALGASSCGCFGAVEVNPWITLVTDVTFLTGLLLLGRREPRLALTATLETRRVVAMGIWSLSAFAVSFGLPAEAPQVAENTPDTDLAVANAALPKGGYYLPNYEDWMGSDFRDLEIASWISDLPGDLGNGLQYVLFYRKDCEHCHDLMELHFSGVLPAPTLAVAVPERAGFPTENLQAFPCRDCRLAELPAGVDWFLQTPVLVRLSDGIVECAAEVDSLAPECLEY